MPSSGGSVSDAPVNKVVDGKSHYLAYITPDEGKSLKDQGGQEVITDSGIPAYPPDMGDPAYGGNGSSSSSSSGNGGYQNVHQTGAVSQTPGRTVSTDTKGDGGYQSVHDTGAITQTPGRITDTTETKDSLITKVKNKVISKTDALDIASKLGWVTDNAFIDAIGGAWTLAMGMGSKVQQKAITWDLNRKLTAVGKQKDFHPGSHSMQIQDLQDKIERANLPKDDPNHYGQDDWTRDYGKIYQHLMMVEILED